MSGTKRSYNLDEKNYFKFFGIEEKFHISTRSLTNHYKKIITILNSDNSFLSKDKLSFAERAFDVLVDPISRARYIVELQGLDTDLIDNENVDEFVTINQLRIRLNETTDIQDLDMFIEDIREFSEFIIQQIETSIDQYHNYNVVIPLISRFNKIAEIHKEAKQKQDNIREGVVYLSY